MDLASQPAHADQTVAQPAAARAAAPDRPGLRFAEFALLYFGIPTALALWPDRPPRITLTLLWIVAAVLLVCLWRSRTLDRSALWVVSAWRGQWPSILAWWLAGIAVMTSIVWIFLPHRLFALPLHRPHIWLMIMAFYPLLSASIQGLTHRLFFFHRYGPVFPTPALRIAASASAFAWMHVVFGNWQAVVLTIPVGILFACRYEKTRSFLLTNIEHALWGCWLFTCGLGFYFFGNAGTRAFIDAQLLQAQAG